ncbi:uncharacterized protein LOC141632839 [Silene latifolia]|uniref:uncharacterized protein LOC141632839 n=1 Tax=Silene latifolia TaxID=37657 RepID=UPI003D771992
MVRTLVILCDSGLDMDALPQLKGEDPGKFRQLDEIMFLDGYPRYHHLLGISEKSMCIVCEVKGHSLNKPVISRTVGKIKKTLLTLDKDYAAQDEKLADGVLMLGEYLRNEPWMELLCNHLRLKD